MIDWSLLLASIINISKEHSLSMGLIKEYHKPAPSKWAIEHIYDGKRGKDQWEKRRKRRLVDSASRVVAEDLNISTADFLCQVTPEAVMVMMDTIDDMAQIIATHRNEGLVRPVHEPDAIRFYHLKKNSRSVQEFLRRQHALILKKNGRAEMAAQRRETKLGGKKPTEDRIQQQIDSYQSVVDEHRKHKYRKRDKWGEKRTGLPELTPDSKVPSQSRNTGGTSATGKRRSSKTGRNPSST